MKQFKGKVAVITGAASGIGLAIAKKCAQEKMKIVLADIEASVLSNAEEEIKEITSDVISVVTDVSNEKDVTKLARNTIDKFGEVHLLFNNAGVLGPVGPIWEVDLLKLNWLFKVNLFGVIYGIREFIPIMLKQNEECHIINTSSIAGLFAIPNIGSYVMSKYGLVALSEALYFDLHMKETNIDVSVLCPGAVDTNIIDSDRNLPSSFAKSKEAEREAKEEFLAGMRKTIKQGISPEKVADIVFEGIKNNAFYILTHPESKEVIKNKMNDILENRSPTMPEFEFIKKEET